MKNIITAILALVAMTPIASSDDYQCIEDTGCVAIQSTENGTRKVRFKKGDIVTTSGGWIVNPADGWVKVDAPYDNYAATAGLLPFWNSY